MPLRKLKEPILIACLPMCLRLPQPSCYSLLAAPASSVHPPPADLRRASNMGILPTEEAPQKSSVTDGKRNHRKSVGPFGFRKTRFDLAITSPRYLWQSKRYLFDTFSQTIGETGSPSTTLATPTKTIKPAVCAAFSEPTDVESTCMVCVLFNCHASSPNPNSPFPVPDGPRSN